MKLRHESKLKDKMEFQLDTKHVFYLVLWSIILSGTIFYIGLFVGQKGEQGVRGFTMNNTLRLKKKQTVEAGLSEPLVNSWSFVARLVKHPEKERLEDAALDAIAGLREDILSRVRKEEERERKKLEKKLFAPRDNADQRPRNPQELLDETRGIRARGASGRPRLGQAPDLSEAAGGPEEAAVPEAPAEEEAVASAPEEQAAGSTDRSYAIQAKAFREKSDAVIFLNYIKQELTRSKYKPFIMPVELPGKGRWYRVRIGLFNTRLDAEKFKTRFEKKLGLETFLVTQ